MGIFNQERLISAPDLIEQSNIGTGSNEIDAEVLLFFGVHARVYQIRNTSTRSIVDVCAHLKEHFQACFVALCRLSETIIDRV